MAEVEVKKPALTYKIAFLIGGVLFAGVTYAIGTWLYELEGQRVRGLPLALDYLGSVTHIPSDHPVTFVPWIVGTTLLSIALGYLFDRQVQYRRIAENLQAKAEMLAVVDGLTQLYNHAYFVEQLGLEIKRMERHLGGMALLLLDIDDFKVYNDTHGHLQGNELLRRVARIIKGAVRETDLVARYGGEEFVVIAQAATGEHRMSLAERIRLAIELSTPITVSIGVAAYPEDGQSVEELIDSADKAMYRAKAQGKNQVLSIA